jgi:hypothetical protein
MTVKEITKEKINCKAKTCGFKANRTQLELKPAVLRQTEYSWS